MVAFDRIYPADKITMIHRARWGIRRAMRAYFMNKLSVLAIAGALTLASHSQAGAEEKVSPSTLKRLFPGQFQAIVKGYKVRFRATGNGRLYGTYKNLKDQGRWSVRSGRLCIMLKEWMNGQTKCSSVTKQNGWYQSAQVQFRKL